MLEILAFSVGKVIIKTTSHGCAFAPCVKASKQAEGFIAFLYTTSYYVDIVERM